MDYWIVTIRCFYLKSKVLWIFVCIHPHSVEYEKKHSQILIQYNKMTNNTQTNPYALILPYMWSYTCLKVSLAPHVTEQWEWKSAWNPAQFEHDLSNSFIKISLVFRITPRKCQLGKPLINDKQPCNYAWYSARLRLLPCRGVWTPLCCGHARATGPRGEADWLLARSELK